MGRRIIRAIFYGAIVPLSLGICGWQGWAWWSWASAPPVEASETNDRAAVQIQIPRGTPGQQIGRDLERAGLIRSTQAWNLWSRWMRWRDGDGGFKAGVYELSPTEPLETIAGKIWRGEVMQSRFTIREGWSIEQMADYFEQRGFFSAQDFVAATRSIPQTQYPWLPNDLPHLEGFLYPDTYQLPSDRISAEAIVRQMLDRFETIALPEYRNGRNPLQLNLREWVALASIVEKEAVVAREREQIAGVFTQRLDRGMRLAADPTVEYGLGVKQTPDRPLTYRQVETPSPYNTYLNPGLPPTPIASPGLPSLKATLSPAETEYLYFVARYDGTHIFSRTLAEHEAAIDKVRQQRRDRQS